MFVLQALADASVAMVVRASWCTTLVVPLAWLTCHFLRRVPRQVHCWIWRLAYIKIAFVAFLTTTIPLPVLPSVEFEAPSIEAVATPIELDALGRTTTKQNNHSLSESPRMKDFACVGWILGVAWMLVRFLREWRFSLHVRKTAANCEPSQMQRSYREAAAAIGVQRPPKLVLTEKLSVPALVGILAPVVALPREFDESSTREQLGLVLRHELGHFRRFDLGWSLLPRALSSLLFFHPLIWLANYRWRLSQECACDELVVEVSGHRIRSYAETLLAVTRLASEEHNLRFASIGIVGSFRSLQERIKTMQTSKRWSRLASRRAGYVFAIASCIAIVPWQLVAQVNDTPGTDLPTAVKNEPTERRLMPVLPDTNLKTPQVEFLRNLGAGQVQLNKNGDVVGVSLAQRNADALLGFLTGANTVERLFLAEVEMSEEGLVQLGSLDNLRELHLANISPKGFDDESFKFLRKLTELEVLTLQGISIDGHGLGHLAELEKLRDLVVRDCDFADDGLKHVRKLEGLESLILASTKNRSLKNLRGMKSLKFLDVQSTPIDDAGLEALSSLENLTNLNIPNTPVRGEGLKHISKLNKLCFVMLEGEQFRHAAEHLRTMEPLHLLNVVKADLRDSDVPLFNGFRHLKSVHLHGSELTDAGVEAIRELLPNAHVSNRAKPSKTLK